MIILNYIEGKMSSLMSPVFRLGENECLFFECYALICWLYALTLHPGVDDDVKGRLSE